MNGRGAGETDEKRGDGRALDAAEAADDHDGEAEQDDGDADAGLHRDFRRGEGAAERRQEHPEGEGEHEDAGDIDAHGAADVAIMDHRQDDLAADGAVEPEPEQESR